MFNDAATEFIEHNAALVTAAPLTIAGWFYSDDAAVSQTIAAIGRTAADHRFHLRANGTAVGDPVQIVTAVGGTSEVVATTTGYSVNTWHHACGVWTSTTARAVYIDGGSVATGATSLAPLSLDRTSIGRVNAGGGSTYMSGRIAEVGIWNEALSLSEITALAKGVSVRLIRPAALVSQPPVWGLHSPEIDLVKSGATWTVTGTVFANHAPVRPFTRRERAIFYSVSPPQTLNATAASGAIAAVAASLAPGAVTLNATAAQAALAAVTAALIAGAKTVLLTAPEAMALAGLGVLSAGAVTLTGTAAQAVLSAVTSMLTRGGPATQYRVTVADVNEYEVRVEQ